ncbi:hemagglutinin protein [Aquimarina sp. 2201CG5-10]|uniref:hemagglutinin protein n=1 Tax=Aquimarina callyspongiae TaxID=3098150 RepID=UPI002AB5A484|nr:hemagglutinin protein [Aquimarina sp. 2201CG5-10]MDY8134880.1 hemagglutinin protein [Aquimarina sp. 2201CG5-10]
MKRLFLTLIGVCTFLGTQAQSIERQVISSGGNTITNGGVTLDYTIGELAVTTITDGTTTLTQGFQQATLQLAIKINPIVFLQGAAVNPNTGEESLMRDDLRVAATIPTTSPYTDAATTLATVFNATGANAIVDWVWVELRDKNDANTVLASKSALLQRDGDIVTTDGTSDLEFELPEDNYYVMVSHRNHLAIRSVNTVALSSTVATLNFSTSSSIAQGGSNAVTDLGNGVFAMLGGDYDENGQVQNSDVNAVVVLLGGSGYSLADMDMNGQIQNTDINNVMNANLGKGEQF